MTNHTAVQATTKARAAPGILGRIRGAVVETLARCKAEVAACLWGGFLGVAPHLLHYSAPLVGTALVAGAGGRLLFGVFGFVATIPILWRLHRRKGGWRAPARALATFAVIFALSSLVLGPALAGVTASESHAAMPPAESGSPVHGR